MGKNKWIFGGLAILLALWVAIGRNRPEDRVINVFSPVETSVESESTIPKVLEFPVVVSGTELIVQNMAQYEGPFLEAEDQEPVARVAALMIYNPGSKMISSAELVLTQGGRTLRFFFTCLPPQSRVLVLEKNRQLYSSEPVRSCLCVSFTEETPQPSSIQVTDSENGLAIVNFYNEDKTVTLYYKQYITEGDFYLGGVTGQTLVEHLAAGESREISAAGYAPGYCRIVAVKLSN